MAKFSDKHACAAAILLIFVAIALVGLTLSLFQPAQAQTGTILTVNGFYGDTKSYTVADLQALPSVSMYGGYYQSGTIEGGLWTGVSLRTLCNQVGGINRSCKVIVYGQGVLTFSYDMISNGINFNPTFKTYNNVTGNLQNQTYPLTAILAYQVNGTSLPSSMQPAPRLVVGGQEQLLIDGTGGKSITLISIVNIATEPSPTPTPTLSPSPTPSSTPVTTHTSTPGASATPTETTTNTPNTTPPSTTATPGPSTTGETPSATSSPTSSSGPTSSPKPSNSSPQETATTPIVSSSSTPSASTSPSSTPKANAQIVPVLLVVAVGIGLVIAVIVVFETRRRRRAKLEIVV